MEIKQTIVKKTFYVQYHGAFYYADYINSDGQTLELLNRNNWEIYNEDNELLDVYSFKSDNKKIKLKIKNNRKLAKKLIEFCIKHFEDYTSLNYEKELKNK